MGVKEPRVKIWSHVKVNFSIAYLCIYWRLLTVYQGDERRSTHNPREGRKWEQRCSTDDALMSYQHLHRITLTPWQG
jgi:hypothetical protein